MTTATKALAERNPWILMITGLLVGVALATVYCLLSGGTPTACEEAIETADKALLLASESAGATGDLIESIENSDVYGARNAMFEFERIHQELEPLVEPYLSAKADCLN